MRFRTTENNLKFFCQAFLNLSQKKNMISGKKPAGKERKVFGKRLGWSDEKKYKKPTTTRHHPIRPAGFASPPSPKPEPGGG
jgi:hypothetical protein